MQFAVQKLLQYKTIDKWAGELKLNRFAARSCLLTHEQIDEE